MLHFGQVNVMVSVEVVMRMSACGGCGGAGAGVVTTGVEAVGVMDVFLMGVCLVLPLLFLMIMHSKRDDCPLLLKMTSWDSRNLCVRQWTS